ncbi:kinesin motor protein cin8 [Blyttiomyces sp. JEL0837]|nr:kinesin motor protein cin8 [Blyttiomyces sp. JEL0837]
MDSGKETNINVVVRVRPRNGKEIKENSPVVVTTNGAKSKELFVRPNPQDSSSKTYHFDKVFGPEADQETIFGEVVAPILEETGTGKTYTMEGDLDTFRGQHAGIIPRTLYSLFDCLGKDDNEYSVRVSFIEIYNEELRDLLSVDDNSQKLKIFEDTNRKGSNEVHGMERVLVNTAADVIAILQKGSQKRQTAATKMNESSSRSHCIFTITVHIKEATADGEDLLKVGKLNLVDLAGSENIGRSGAENRRAKEAGMINQSTQSLLTLGRVINALVEKGLHIPYRESKLTRLLQDSLGGKTKTCIIAAVSPAKANIEETLSTLDYAHRAKNIRNKPEVNQKMTKKALIKEYETLIERLKADLQATRDKNGVYLSADTYTSMVDEQQSRKDQLEEMLKIIQAREDAIKRVEESFQENMLLLDETKSKLDGTTVSFESKRLLPDVKQNLDEQRLLTEAHAATENHLNSLANGLVQTLQTTVRDIHGLHEKLERKSALEIANIKLFREFQSTIMDEISEMESACVDMRKYSSDFSNSCSMRVAALKDLNIEKSQSVKATSLSDGEALMQTIEKLSALAAQNANKESENIRVLTMTAKQLIKSTARKEEENRKFRSEAVKSIEKVIREHESEMKGWQTTVTSRFSSMMTTVQDSLRDLMSRQMLLHNAFSESMATEIQRLETENKDLRELVARQEDRATANDEAFLSAISKLVTDYSAEKNAARKELQAFACNGITGSITDILLKANIFSFIRHIKSKEYVGTLAKESQDSFNSFLNVIDSDARNIQTELDNSALTLENGVADLVMGVASCEREDERRQQAMIEEMNSNVITLDDESNKILVECTSHAEAESEVMKETQEVIKLTSLHVNEQISQLESQLQDLMHSHSEELASYQTFVQTYLDDHTSYINRAKNNVECNNLSRDTPTGKTPRKRAFQIPTELVRTRDHDEILHEYRTNREVPPVTMIAAPAPLPAYLAHLSNSAAAAAECENQENSDRENDTAGLPDSVTIRSLGKIRGGAGTPTLPQGVSSKLPRHRAAKKPDSPLKEIQ